MMTFIKNLKENYDNSTTYKSDRQSKYNYYFFSSSSSFIIFRSLNFIPNCSEIACLNFWCSSGVTRLALSKGNSDSLFISLSLNFCCFSSTYYSDRVASHGKSNYKKWAIFRFSNCPFSLFFFWMFRVFSKQEIRISKNSDSLFKANAMFKEVRLSFIVISFKAHL